MATELINLSYAVQVSLASGYLAYLIAYAGIRQHHTTADAVLKSFAFGLAATAIMKWGYQVSFWTPAVAVALTLATGVLWRWFGLAAWEAIARHAKISWSDDIPTAWISVTATKTNASPTQIAVEIADGRILMCDDTRRFEDAHGSPFVLGLTGDVAMYVTAEMRPDGTWEEKQAVRHSTEGDLLTYIPVAQIKRVEFRYLSEKGAAAARVEEARLGALAPEKAAGPNLECRSGVASSSSDSAEAAV